MLSTVDFSAATLSKPKTRTLLTYWKLDWPQNILLSNWNCQSTPTETESYHYLQQVWKQEQMSSFKHFLRWYNKIDVVPTLEAMQKMIAFYHDEKVDMLNIGCTLRKLANIFLGKSTDAKFYPFTEGDKDQLDKVREDVVGGPSIVFTRKANVDETFIGKSTNICKSIVGIDATQLYFHSMCQPMPTGLYIRWDIDSETSRFLPWPNKTRSFGNMVMTFFQRTRLDCKIESFSTTGRQKKIDPFSVDGFYSHCKTVFEAMDCCYHFCPCQEIHSSLTEEDIKRGSTKTELDELRRGCILEKDFTVIEMWECECWRLYKTTTNVKLHIWENFPHRRSLTEHHFLRGIKKRNLFGYAQCILRANFANFPPLFEYTLVSKNDIGNLMKTYAEEEGILSQSRKMLISSFILKNGTWLLLCSYSICNSGLLFQKHPVLLSALQRNVSTALYRHQWTQEWKMTKIPIQVSLRRRWSC